MALPAAPQRPARRPDTIAPRFDAPRRGARSTASRFFLLTELSAAAGVMTRAVVLTAGTARVIGRRCEAPAEAIAAERAARA